MSPSLASSLRRRQTTPEGRLWGRLRNRRFHGYKFRRQHPIDRWIVDFVCLERRLIIELDGTFHAMKIDADRIRDDVLQHLGFFVLRIPNHLIYTDMEHALRLIRTALERDPWPPSP